VLERREMASKLLGAVADDDGSGGRSECGRRAQDVIDERQPGNAVQHLGDLGFHPSALPGGEDHDMEVRHRG
jgi:hypothetical protein